MLAEFALIKKKASYVSTTWTKYDEDFQFQLSMKLFTLSTLFIPKGNKAI